MTALGAALRLLFVVLTLLTIGIVAAGAISVGFALRDAFCYPDYWSQVRNSILLLAAGALPTLGGLTLLACRFTRGRAAWLPFMPAFFFLIAFLFMLVAEYGTVAASRDYCAASDHPELADSAAPAWPLAEPLSTLAAACFGAFLLSALLILFTRPREPLRNPDIGHK